MFILEMCGHSGISILLGVYSTEEIAKKMMRKAKKKEKNFDGSNKEFRIISFVLDAEPDFGDEEPETEEKPKRVKKKKPENELTQEQKEYIARYRNVI